MTTIIDLKLVTIDNVHEMIPNYIHENKIIITDYEDMINVVLDMIKNKHFFNMDKNFLRGCMEDLTYMYSPNDIVNKDRIVQILEPSDDEDDDVLQNIRNQLINNINDNDDNDDNDNQKSNSDEDIN